MLCPGLSLHPRHPPPSRTHAHTHYEQSSLSLPLEMRLFAKGEGEGHCGYSAIMEPVLGIPVLLILLYCSVYVPTFCFIHGGLQLSRSWSKLLFWPGPTTRTMSCAINMNWTINAIYRPLCKVVTTVAYQAVFDH